MALNTQFPDWLRQDTRDATGAGIAIGRNMLEGLRLRQQQEQFQAEQPIRQAQVAASQAQTKGLVNRANLEALNLQQRQKELGSMADALALESDIAGSANGYANPENRARFYSFVSERPWLAEGEWAAGMNKKFEISDSLALKAEKLQNDLEAAKLRNQALVDAATVRGEATTTAAETRAAAAEARAANPLPTAAMRNAGAYKAALEAGDQVTADIIANGGRVEKISQPIRVKLIEKGDVVDGLDSTVKLMDDFMTQWGENALNAYFGQFDVPFNQLLDIVRTRKGEQDKAALKIIQRFSDVRNGKYKTISGGTVTESEGKRLEQAVGTTKSKQFPLTLRNFLENERRDLSFQVDAWQDQRLEVPKTVVDVARRGQASAKPRSSGIRVISIEPAP